MNDRDPKTLILHRDRAWRRSAADVFAGRGLPCVTADVGCNTRAVEAPEDVAVVVGSVTSRRGGTTQAAIERLRQWSRDGRIIAIVPTGDARATREAFRAGAWDCIEEPVDPAELADRVAEALRERPAPRDGRRPKTATVYDSHARPNPSAFLDALAGLRSLCRRDERPLCVMMLDMVAPARGNDSLPMPTEDQILTWFASNLKDVCRRSDPAARYHGSTFIVALPYSRGPEAVEFARRFQDALRTRPLTVRGRIYPISASIGIAESTIGFIETGHHLVQRARLALEQAHRDNGGRIVTWSQLVENEPSHRDVGQLSVEGASQWIERVRQQLRSTYVESTRALVAAVEAKDPCTEAHSMTVAAYAETIGKRMKLPSGLVNTLRAAALLHDVGKIGVPDAILTKSGPLTDEEFAVVKRHPETGLEILGHVSFLTDERPLILYHHERYDGTGYLYGLTGNQIPIGARVLAMADALDAMLSERTYKKAYDMERVRREITAETGRQFDPSVAAATLRWLHEKPEELTVPTAKAASTPISHQGADER